MLPLLRHRNRTASSDETPENPEPDNPKHESMNGSRLGRGRGGRLAVYAGSLVGLLLLVMVYRAAVSEMARLREIHVQCTHDKESLAAQFQVISEYKMRIEKSLADEKSANVAAKQELEHRATIEKSQRDKDLVEANHRYNSLDQEFKTLKTQYKDYLDECAMKQQQASEEKTRLENTLQELRTEVLRAQEDRDAAKNSLENFKNKYLAVETEKGRFENMYNDMVKTNEATAMEKQKLEKHVHQLKIELEDVKRSCGQPAAPPSFVGEPNGAAPKEAEGGQDAGAAMNLAKPPAPQQVSPPSDGAGGPPQPIQPPQNHVPVRPEDGAQVDPASNVGFEVDEGVVVPAGPNAAEELDRAALNDNGNKPPSENVADNPNQNNAIPNSGNAGDNDGNVLAAPNLAQKTSSAGPPGDGNPEAVPNRSEDPSDPISRSVIASAFTTSCSFVREKIKDGLKMVVHILKDCALNWSGMISFGRFSLRSTGSLRLRIR
nr:tropomyosin-1, isoforms 33/34-like isoform X2 [Neodiprion pinetum]